MKRIIYLGIAVFAVMLLWCGAWLYAGNEVKKAVLSLATADGESAPKLSCDSLDVAGFPFRFDVTCTGATLVSQDTTVAVAELRASVLVYDPWHALAFAN